MKPLVMLLSLLVAVAFSNVVDAADPPTPQTVVVIKDMITKIGMQHSAELRANLAGQLVDYIQQSEQSDVNALDVEVIDDLAHLLNDTDDDVRCWAALSLGQIGPRATRTIPALEKALRSVYESYKPLPGSHITLLTGTDSSGCMLGALRLITGKPLREILAIYDHRARLSAH